MNGLPAILLAVSSALTTVSSLFEGKKRNAMVFSGLGIAFTACAIAAACEGKKRKKKDGSENGIKENAEVQL